MLQKAKSVKKGTAKKAAVKKAPSRKAVVKKSAAKKAATVKKTAQGVKQKGFSVSGVRFLSGGLNCEGRLYLPKGIKKPPVIIMAYGFGAEMDFGIPAYAEEFAKNGYAAFIFNYRYYGGSEGEPKHFISQKKQLEDWNSAIEFVRSLDQVDAERICIWGCSFSGGHVFVMAALNRSVKGFISTVPFIDSMFIVKISGMKKVFKINIAAYRDLFRSLLRKEPFNIPVIGRPDEFAILNTPECYDGYRSMIPENSAWENVLPARSMLVTTFYRPFRYIKKINCKGLVIMGEGDTLTDNLLVEKSFSDLRQVDLLKYPCGHFKFFEGEYFKKSLSAELKFLEGLF